MQIVQTTNEHETKEKTRREIHDSAAAAAALPATSTVLETLTPDHSRVIHLGQSCMLHASVVGGFTLRQASSGIYYYRCAIVVVPSFACVLRVVGVCVRGASQNRIMIEKKKRRKTII